MTGAVSIGDSVKVSRFAERLWLKVTRVHPGGTFTATIDNHPICWADVNGNPLFFGDFVVISEPEIIETMRVN